MLAMTKQLYTANEASIFYIAIELDIHKQNSSKQTLVRNSLVGEKSNDKHGARQSSGQVRSGLDRSGVRLT
jgi:hypothetical protein